MSDVGKHITAIRTLEVQVAQLEQVVTALLNMFGLQAIQQPAHIRLVPKEAPAPAPKFDPTEPQDSPEVV